MLGWSAADTSRRVYTQAYTCHAVQVAFSLFTFSVVGLPAAVCCSQHDCAGPRNNGFSAAATGYSAFGE